MNLVLDFAESPGQVIRRCFSNPVAVLTATHLDQVPDVLAEVDRATRSGAYAAGFLSYESAPAFEPATKVRQPDGSLPLVQFGLYDSPVPAPPHQPARSGPINPSWTLDTDRETYARKIDAIHAAIEAGDTYQINFTLRAHAQLNEAVGFAYYEQLRRAQVADYCAWLDLGTHQILSVSPELFFFHKDNRVTTRPMKGTARRGYMPEEDAALAQWLHESRKNRAENLMIVDLLRNDLSRLSGPGDVTVPSLFTIERYPTLLQMTSTIEARIREGLTLYDLLAALFPCGSITGAPKIKTMEWITRLETTPRGPYCGSIGLIKPGGEALFNVAIRTVVLETATGAMTCGLGGGITWDSQASEEYDEVLTKSRFLNHEQKDFELIETLLLENSNWPLQSYHLDRLAHSAQALGFPKPPISLVQTIANYGAQYPAGSYRVRLCYGKSGTVMLEGFALEAHPTQPVPVTLSHEPVNSTDPWLAHKTTRRESYERHLVGKPEQVYDVLLWNERREVTEFTRGNLVAEIRGQRVTPPLHCGLLPGTLRQSLLDEGTIIEQVLLLDDLPLASHLWFINSVRGWVEVKL